MRATMMPHQRIREDDDLERLSRAWATFAEKHARTNPHSGLLARKIATCFADKVRREDASASRSGAGETLTGEAPGFGAEAQASRVLPS